MNIAEEAKALAREIRSIGKRTSQLDANDNIGRLMVDVQDLASMMAALADLVAKAAGDKVER